MLSQVSISFELAPFSEQQGSSERDQLLQFLEMIQPRFVSVLYKPQLYTLEQQIETVAWLINHLTCSVVPHITCYGHTKESLSVLLATYHALGVQELLLIRGDDALSQDCFRSSHALIQYIKLQHPYDFHVADYPDAYQDKRKLVPQHYQCLEKKSKQELMPLLLSTASVLKIV